MNTRFYLRLITLCCLLGCMHVLKGQTAKARLIILADMGNEPDEEQQMVHMMMYSNEFDLEGLIAVSGKFLHSQHHLPERTRLYPDLFHKIIDAYALELDDLKRHATGWPDPIYLRSIVVSGQPDYGVAGVGEGKSTEGSELIIRAVEKEDARPIYVVVNAGSNTLAQAIRDYESSHTRAELEAFITKLRVYENGAQDDAGAWICAHYPSIHWIRSNVQTYCYGGPDFDRKKDGRQDESTRLGPYTWKPYAYSSMGQHQWALEHIKGDHGRLGAAWPLRQTRTGRIVYLEGGGTIPWLGLIHQGLSDINYPHWGGWSGRFTQEKVAQVFSKHESVRKDEINYGHFALYTEAIDLWTDPESGLQYENNFAPVWRWREAMYNDFACRMDWCVIPFSDANHNPVITIDGDNQEKIHYKHIKAGSALTINTLGTIDPDGDQIDIQGWIYREAGTFSGNIVVDHSKLPEIKLYIPAEAESSEIHLIIEASDDHSTFSMHDYRRIIIEVK